MNNTGRRLNTRKILARTLMALVYVGLAVFAFVFGRGHAVFFNNYALGPETVGVTVSVDGEASVKIRPDGMKSLTAKGPDHRFRVEFSDKRPAFEGAFSVPLFADVVVIPVSGLKPGASVVVIPGDSSTEER